MLPRKNLSSELLRYLVDYDNGLEDPDRIPSLGDLSAEIGVSIPKLREQLEVARALGFVEVRPRTGIRRMPYEFAPAVSQSLLYALALDAEQFRAFSELRNHVEAGFWRQAVTALGPAEHRRLQDLVSRAWESLRGEPVKIPHSEHRKLHLTIFSKLENPFVQGILEAYWEAYEAVELNLYADYSYLHEVWSYHQRIVEAICAGDVEASYQAFVDHTELLRHRPAAKIQSKK